MDSQIRVQTDARYAKLYNDLKNFVVGDFHELFFVLACLGYQKAMKKQIGKNGDNRFWSSTITPFEWAAFYSMYIATNGMDVSKPLDDRLVISDMEEYANAGMEVLLDDLLASFTFESEGFLTVDRTISKELPRHFLSYLYGREN